jgi:hypothetical protein
VFIPDELTPRSTVLHKLKIAQQLEKIPSFYGIRKFIAVFTKAPHWTYPESDVSSPHTLSNAMRHLLDSLIVARLVKKFDFHGT